MNNEPKHTPGPWWIEDISKGCDFPLIHGADYSEVAIAYPGDTLGKEPRLDAMYANARLIAAAPDLLAACKMALRDLVDFLDGLPDGIRSDDSATTEALRAAIAKAEK